MNGVIVGIDPGQKGAIAMLANDYLQVWDLKDCIKPTGTFNSLDPELLHMLILSMTLPRDEGVAIFCEESQTHKAAGTTSIKTARSVFDARGVMRAVFQMRGYEITYIQPQTWKRHLGLLRQDKFASVEKAEQIFPTSRDIFWKKHHKRDIPLDGRAEAALIAHYGYIKDSIRKSQL